MTWSNHAFGFLWNLNSFSHEHEKLLLNEAAAILIRSQSKNAGNTGNQKERMRLITTKIQCDMFSRIYLLRKWVTDWFFAIFIRKIALIKMPRKRRIDGKQARNEQNIEIKMKKEVELPKYWK